MELLGPGKQIIGEEDLPGRYQQTELHRIERRAEQQQNYWHIIRHGKTESLAGVLLGFFGVLNRLGVALSMTVLGAFSAGLPANCAQGAHFRTAGERPSHFVCTGPGVWSPVGALPSNPGAPRGVPKASGGRGQPAPAASLILNVTSFGAKGDGVTDDYDALRAAAEFVCSSPGTTLVFPPGTYYLGRYRITGGRNRNNVRSIRYNGCRGVVIYGPGAKIDVFGSFHRRADFRAGDYAGSYSAGIIPFEFIGSSDFVVSGFEIDGNVDQMTREMNVVEADNAGILTTHCSDYTIEDVDVHHFQTDGIKLGGNAVIADRRALLRNVKSSHNGRLALAMIQVRTAAIADSVFSDTGRTGRYGVHDPGAGADVEPNRTTPAVDVKTGALIFDQCRFENNIGPQFVSMWPDRVDSIAVRRSTISAVSTDVAPMAFLNASARGQTLCNRFEIGPSSAVMLTCPKPERCRDIVKLIYRGNELTLAGRSGLYSSSNRGGLPRSVDFTGNRVSVNSAGPENSPLLFANLERVEDNVFFLGAKGYAGPTGSGPWAVAYFNVSSVRNNRYTTDLTGPRFFQTVYYGGCCADGAGELFPGRNFRAASVQR